MKLRKNDNIKIIAGKEKGKTGKITNTLPKKGKVVIDGLNMYKKHVRPKRQGEKGQTISVSRPIDVSNVMLICASCGKTTRIGIEIAENGSKKRYCKRCNVAIT